MRDESDCFDSAGNESGTGNVSDVKTYYDSLAEAGKYRPVIFLDDEAKMREFHVFNLRCLSGMEQRSFDTVSDMLECWSAGRSTGNRMKQKSTELRSIIKTCSDKLSLKKQRLLEDLQKAENAGEYKKKGELITANIHALKKGQKEAVLLDYSQDPAEEVKVTLDPLLSPSQNAQKLFKRYAKFKTAVSEKKKQLEITDQELMYLESCEVYLDNSKTPEEIDDLKSELIELAYVRRRRRHTPARPAAGNKLKFKTSDGLRILVGRNGKENDELSMKKAGQADLWLHTKDIPGSHVILEAPGGGKNKEAGSDKSRKTKVGINKSAKGKSDINELFGERSIKEAAQIAAYYSKARDSENVPVDYTLIKYVKKPSGAKPGMVIYTHQKTIYVKPGLITPL